LSVLVLFVAGTLYWWLIELPRFQSGNEGFDFAGGTVVGFRVAPVIVVAAVAFISGVWWVLRRQTA
jgi:hypothetical protein